MFGIHTLLILSSVLAVGTSLKCYECISSSSWDDCENKKVKVRCIDSYITKCIKVEGTETNSITGKVTHAYAKGCAKTCNKYDIPVCRKDQVTCTLHCCSGDYCNTGSSLVASIIIPAICALISVVSTI